MSDSLHLDRDAVIREAIDALEDEGRSEEAAKLKLLWDAMRAKPEDKSATHVRVRGMCAVWDDGVWYLRGYAGESDFVMENKVRCGEGDFRSNVVPVEAWVPKPAAPQTIEGEVIAGLEGFVESLEREGEA